ncbi:permease-like cell division protein FtsX [Clostridium ihumii]|uniref:permease-like cell division protein FtsX n=1 Tax=Clostridium ihumii TaxID=1470356 RepID=UPI003D34FB1C
MKLKTATGLFKEGFYNMLKNRLVSIVAISTVFISLSIFGIIYMFINIVNENINNMQGEVEVVAFLDENIEKSEVASLQKEIENMDNVKSVEYVSSEEGLKEYNESLSTQGDTEMAQILNEVVEETKNPIPASFSIKTVEPTKNEEVKENVDSLEAIYKVNDSSVITSFLQKFSKYTKIIGGAFIIGLVVASVLLISNSIKVAIFVRKKEISIIKYIGATNNYIRLPFIMEGFLIGTIGALLSAGVISIIYYSATGTITNVLSQMISGFVMPSLSSLLILLVPIMILIGSGIGILGSLISIRKYLKV